MKLLLSIGVFSVRIMVLCQTIPFIWSSDQLNGTIFEKTAMHLPLKFPNDKETYYFQFDTGANTSCIYMDNEHWFSTPMGGQSVTTSLGNLTLSYNETNSMYEDSLGRKHIGTIGADWLQGKIIEIDYPIQEIRIVAGYDGQLGELYPMRLSFGRPVFDLFFNGKKYGFMFDTGSSLFELWTTKRIYNKLRDKTLEASIFPISSWGRINNAYRSKLKAVKILFFGQDLPSVSEVWYNSNKSFQKNYKFLQIDGIIGNKPFLDRIIILDFKNQKVGIKK